VGDRRVIHDPSPNRDLGHDACLPGWRNRMSYPPSNNPDPYGWRPAPPPGPSVPVPPAWSSQPPQITGPQPGWGPPQQGGPCTGPVAPSSLGWVGQPQPSSSVDRAGRLVALMITLVVIFVVGIGVGGSLVNANPGTALSGAHGSNGPAATVPPNAP